MNTRMDIAVLYLALVLVLSMRLISSDCDPDFGPAGDTDCYQSESHFFQYQCGTCVSSQNIQRISAGNYFCPNAEKFCYFGCMLKLYNLGSGPVLDACKCTSGSLVNPSQLPPDCFTPNVTDCTWYSRCLAAQYPCAGQAAYALDYGEHFCNLYEQNLPLFSANGQTWIGAVRNCIQDQLAPIISFCSQPSYTCDQVEQKSLDTHTLCYLEAYQGISVCDLTSLDSLRIFYTIESSLNSDFSASLKSFWSTVLVVGKKCASYKTNGWVQEVTNNVFQVVSIFVNRLTFNKRSVPMQDVSNDEIAYAVITSIASQLDWTDKNSIRWFAYAAYTTTGDGLSIQLLIADSVKLGLIPTSNRTQLGLNGTLLQLIDITNQSLVISLTDLNLKFVLTSLVACSPYDLSDGCRNGTLLAGSTPPPKDNVFTTTLIAGSTPPPKDNVFTTTANNAPTCFLPLIIANILVFFIYYFKNLYFLG